jgi:hypothetical protein
MKTLDMTKYNFYTDGKTKVVAVSTYAGKTVRGVAKCDVNDTFSLEKGKELAAARCNEKVAKKRLTRAQNVHADTMVEYLKLMRKLDKNISYKKDSQVALTEAENLVASILETM